MPSKNSIKTYVEGGVYHVYNRGVNKQNIFVDDEDYSYFLTLLERYLIDGKISGYSNSFYNKIGLYSFCLMPSHIHLVLEQVERVNMTGFVRALSISYVMYINKKYQRVGHLFQDKYKARLITNEESFLAMERREYLFFSSAKRYSRAAERSGFLSDKKLIRNFMSRA